MPGLPAVVFETDMKAPITYAEVISALDKLPKVPDIRLVASSSREIAKLADLKVEGTKTPPLLGVPFMLNRHFPVGWVCMENHTDRTLTFIDVEKGSGYRISMDPWDKRCKDLDDLKL